MDNEIKSALNVIPDILKILKDEGDFSEETIKATFAGYLDYLYYRDNCSLTTIAYIGGYMEGLLNKDHSSEIKTSKKGIAFLEGNSKGLKDAQNYPMLGNIGNAKAIEDDEQEHY